MLLKTQTFFCLEHQWTHLNGWVGNWRKISNSIKVILLTPRITKQKKEYWGVPDRDVLFFPKKIYNRKIKFLQCLCYCWCFADSHFQDNDFYDITSGSYLRFECSFRFMQMPYFERKVIKWIKCVHENSKEITLLYVVKFV